MISQLGVTYLTNLGCMQLGGIFKYSDRRFKLMFSERCLLRSGWHSKWIKGFRFWDFYANPSSPSVNRVLILKEPDDQVVGELKIVIGSC